MCICVVVNAKTSTNVSVTVVKSVRSRPAVRTFPAHTAVSVAKASIQCAAAKPHAPVRHTVTSRLKDIDSELESNAVHFLFVIREFFPRIFNPLKGRRVNWLHFAIQV